MMNKLPENIDRLSDAEIEAMAQQLMREAAAKDAHQRNLLAFLNDRRRGVNRDSVNRHEQQFSDCDAAANRTDAMERRIAAIEEWADIDFTAAANNGTPDSIHNLIAEGMTDVTTHCMENAAALVTVAAAANDKRIDAVAKQAELLQSLVLNVKELLLNVDARLEALESKAPC